jgi:hypothetical protein
MRPTPIALAACDELSRLADFRGPRANGKVTPATLFRGLTAGDQIGPYLSQFLLQPVNYGTIPLSHAINAYLPLSKGGTDYMVDPVSWLAVQNGLGPFPKNRIDSTPRHIRNGRDLSAYVHIDFTRIEIEKGNAGEDDDWIIFTFGDADPAVSPYRPPDAAATGQ